MERIESPYLTVAQTCDYLNVSHNTAVKVAKEAGALHKVTSCLRIHKPTLDEYVKAQQKGD